MSDKTSDKNVANIEEMNFKRELLQHPISYLTEENLDRLETHCLKAIRYETGIEHKVVLELLERHKEYLAEREQKDKRIKELEEELEKANRQLDLDYVEENFILKQKVMDKIEEYKKKIEEYEEYRIQGKETDIEYYENITNTAIVQVLQEFLGGGK